MFIHVDYKLEADEFARGILAAFRRGHRITQAVGVTIGLLLAAAYAISSAKHLSPPSLWTMTVPMSLGTLYGILQPWIRGLVLRRQHRQRKTMSVGVTLTEDGMTWDVQTKGGEHRSVMGWASLVKIRETPEFFLLYPTRRQATVVPKRAFAPDQAELFSRFVEYAFAQARQAQPEVPAARA
ncbi:MAG TPA: YcxB family protein [Actinospica sp.]|jgi:hypothetical protein|nr:YcxB family protein [Actinospica sp.]